MRTEAKEYSEYLERKYLPGRRFYLRCFFYPKIFRHLPGQDTIVDLGCGTGEFLSFCRTRGRQVLGVDSNKTLVTKNVEAGFEVVLDDVCRLPSLTNRKFKYAICDNVLEHLEVSDIRNFFERVAHLLTSGGLLVCIVPGARGFQQDPTHKTYVCEGLLKEIVEPSCWTFRKYYHHPLNLGKIDKLFYLNMQVFEIERR